HDLEEAASTRLLIHAALLMKAGLPAAAACRAGMIEPLSDDEATVEALMEVVYAVFGRPE
ncbi:MAG: CbbQ/NirQ/NorQ C-terminal domain-containing protein, partial [Marinobacter sp.]|nr:CbbQ/NirQ/NorQ C-terminal domain-containing protein [Marinobacter sp.]